MISARSFFTLSPPNLSMVRVYQTEPMGLPVITSQNHRASPVHLTVSAPAGYSIVGDAHIQETINNETKAHIFQLQDFQSPDPNLQVTIKTLHHNKTKEVSFTMFGKKKAVMDQIVKKAEERYAARGKAAAAPEASLRGKESGWVVGRVEEVVEPDALDAGPLEGRVKLAGDHVLVVHHVSLAVAEHDVVGFALLACPMLGENPCELGSHDDRPGAGGALRRAEAELGAVGPEPC